MDRESGRAERYRGIAQEVRATARLVTSEDARKSLFDVAAAYERMAETLDAERGVELPRADQHRC
jgi:hypothetical protein